MKKRRFRWTVSKMVDAWLVQFFSVFIVDFGPTLDDFETQNGRHNLARSFPRNDIIIWLSKFSSEIAIQ